MSMSFPTRFTPQLVHASVAGCGDDPARRGWGQPCLRPSLGRDHEGVLNRLLGEVDVAKEADQGCDDLAGLFEKSDRLLRLENQPTPQASGLVLEGRTSIRPRGTACVTFSAHLKRRRRDRAPRSPEEPPTCSLVSAYGPSIVTVSPFFSHHRGGVRRMKATAEDPGTGRTSSRCSACRHRRTSSR